MIMNTHKIDLEFKLSMANVSYWVSDLTAFRFRDISKYSIMPTHEYWWIPITYH